jgi:hypothetical protein
MRVFFAFFFFVGAAAFYSITIHPLLQVAAATKWVETPCVVDSSEVIVDRGTKGG